MASKEHQLAGVVHSPVLFLSYINYALKEGEFLALQAPSFRAFQLRNQFVDYLKVVNFPEAVDKARAFMSDCLSTYSTS